MEPGETGTLANRFAVARRRQAPATRAPQRVGQVDDGPKPHRLDFVRFGQGAGRVLETALGQQNHAEPVMRYRVARCARDGLAERGLGLGEALLAGERLGEVDMSVRQGRSELDGAAERLFLVGRLALPPAREPETKMRQRVLRPEPRGLAVGGLGVGP